MDFRPGLSTISVAAVDEVAASASRTGRVVFSLETGGEAGRQEFFDAVRAVLPLDPPLQGSRSWDALSDSAWEGIRRLDTDRVVILWRDATAFRDRHGSEYDIAVELLEDLANTLADTGLTNREPMEVSVFVGID